MKVLLNDQLIDRDKANTINIEDRAYQFGDGIYEGIRVYNGKIFTLSSHLDRLFSSGKK